MSQNPTPNNLNNGNLARSNPNGNQTNMPLYFNNMPNINNRLINPQVRGLNSSTMSIPQMMRSATNTGLQNLLPSNYTSIHQATQNQNRATSSLLKPAENTNSQAEVPVNNIPANNPTVQTGQSANNSNAQDNNFINTSITPNITTGAPVNNPTSQPAIKIENQNVATTQRARSINQNQFTSDFPKFFKSPAEEARKKSNQDKEYEAKHLVPRGIPRKQLDPSKKPTFRTPPKKPVQPQIEKKLVKEFIITGSMINASKKANLMRLHRGNNVLDKFQAPVKLHRRDPEAPAPGTGNARQNEVAVAVAAAAAAAAASASKTTQGPTTGADTSKIAPFAGARHNKKNLFKKRTTQIYLADDRQRQLKAEERLPWILEDYDGTHTWVGQFEETDAKYGFLIKDKQDENKLRFLPSHRWYTFRPQIKYKTLTIEEAEEEMAKAKKRDNDRWMMRRWGKQEIDNEKKLADEEGGAIDLKSTIKTVENEEDLFGSDDEGFRRPRRGIESDEEVEFEQVFEDDEEELPDDANPIDEENAEVVKLKKRAIHKPTSLEDEDENEDSFKLTQEGMQLKKLVRKFDDNEAYDDSDQESNPYASEIEESEEELSSESPARTPVIGAAGTKPTPAKTDKGKTPVKPKSSAKATVKGKAPATSKPKATIEKPKGKATAASKAKSTAVKSIKGTSSLSASEEAPLKPKLKSSDISGASKFPQKSQAKSMVAIPVSSSPEDSAKKQPSKPKNVKSALSTSAKTTAAQSQITSKKQKAGAVRQPTSDMAGKRLSAFDPVSDDEKHITTLKRRQAETITSSTSINRPANVNVSSSAVRTTTGGVKRREVEESMPATSKKVRTEKPVPSSQTSTAIQSTDFTNSRLISEREVRQIINKNSELTVTTIIKAFRKRIHEDSRNRDRLLEITKNVAVLKNGYLVLK